MLKLIIRFITKLFKRLLVSILSVLVLLIFLVLFEVPLPIVPYYVNTFVQQYDDLLKEYDIEDVKVGGIAIVWNYQLNKPLITINNLQFSYKQQQVDLNKIGILPDILGSIKHHKIHISYLYLKNLKLLIKQFDDNKYKINIINDIQNPQQLLDQQFSQQFKKNSINLPDFNGSTTSDQQHLSKELFTFYQDLIKNIPLFSKIESVNIEKIKLFFVDHQQVLEFDVRWLIIADILDNISLKLNSGVLLNALSAKDPIEINLDIATDKDLNFDILGEVQYLSIADLHDYLIQLMPKNSTLNKIKLTNFMTKINIDMLYNLDLGAEKLDVSVVSNRGNINVQDMLRVPIKVKNINYSIVYDKNINKLQNLLVNNNIMQLDVDFYNNNLLQIDNIGLSILLNKLNLQVDLSKLSANKLIIDNISLQSNNKYVNNTGEYTWQDGKLLHGTLTNTLKINNIDLNFLILNWPSNLVPTIRQWFFDNVVKLQADNIKITSKMKIIDDYQIKLDALLFTAGLSDIETSYLPNMPKIYSNNISLSYNLDKFIIIANNVKSDDLNLQRVSVSFYDQLIDNNKHQVLDLHIADNKVDIPKLLTYINKKPLSVLRQYNLKVDTFDGDASGKFDLIYSFTTEDIRSFNVDVDLKQASYYKILFNKDATDINANLHIDMDKLVTKGKASFDDSDIIFDANLNFDKVNPIQNYNIQAPNITIAELVKLGIIPKYYNKYLSGQLDIDIDYLLDQDQEVAMIKANLADTLVTFDEIKYVKQVEQPLEFSGTFQFHDHQLQNIKYLNIINNDNSVNILADINLQNNQQIQFEKLYLDDFIDAHGEIVIKDNNYYIDLTGSYLQLGMIIDKILESKNQSPQKSSKQLLNTNENEFLGDIPQRNEVKPSVTSDDKDRQLVNYYLYFNFDKVYNHDNFIQDVDLQFFYNNNGLQYVNFFSPNKSFLNSNDNYLLFDKTKSVLSFQFADIAYVFNFFDLYNDINSSTVESSIILKEVDNKFLGDDKTSLLSKGTINIANLSVGVKIANTYIDFKGKDTYFYIEDILLTGNILGGRLRGYLDFDTKYVHLYGKLVPIWGASRLLSSVPILKQIFGDSTITDVNANLQGPINDIQYSIFSFDKHDKVNQLDNTEFRNMNID